MISLSRIGHTQHHLIQAYDIDANKMATPIALLKLMHETAMQNVIQLKMSLWDLAPLHLAWVLMRQSIHFERLPTLGETISVITYPSGFEKMLTYRDYRVIDQNGDNIIYGASTWLLMDTKQRKMTKIPDFILDMSKYIPPKEKCLPRSQFHSNYTKHPEKIRTYKVGWFDLDFNGHANNVPYVKWMIEPIGEQLKHLRISTLNVQYKQECLLEEDIYAYVESKSIHQFSHLLCNKEEKILAQAETKWHPI